MSLSTVIMNYIDISGKCYDLHLIRPKALDITPLEARQPCGTPIIELPKYGFEQTITIDSNLKTSN